MTDLVFQSRFNEWRHPANITKSVYLVLRMPSFRQLFARVRAETIVVRCGKKRHRVRLAAGRLWQTARCPSCQTHVDPTRLKRTGRWLLGLTAPRSATPRARMVWMLTAAYLVGTALAAAVLWTLSDLWWLATTLLFGPRWVLLIPLAALVPAVILWDRHLLALLAVAGLIVIGPVMGLQLGWRRLIVRPDASRDITVASFNAMGGESLTKSTVELLNSWGADVAALQECGHDYARTVAGLVDWYTERTSRLCLISRFPILDALQMENEGLQGAGGAGVVVTALLDVNGERVFFTNVHLETPRAGFERIRAGQLISGASKLKEKSALREIELRRARRWIEQFDGPHIVAGDFNTPIESRIYRAAWSDWQNGFSRVGVGFGGTRLNGWIRARIDHILTSHDWIPVRAWIGEDVGSDHAAVITRIRLRSVE